MSDTGEAPRCVECGEPLAQAITPEDVITLKGHTVRFRRHTDFLLCQKSMTLYRITDVRAGNIKPVTDRELMEAGDVVVTPEDDRRDSS
jgi:hypothetical protein